MKEFRTWLRHLLIGAALLASVIFSMSGCGKEDGKIAVVSKLHNGDAKFFQGRVWTGVEGNLTSFDLHGKDRRTYDIKVNWIACLDEKDLLVYGNSAGEVGMVHFDGDNNVTGNDVILSSRNLLIDPAIARSGEDFFLTVIEVTGNVNNDDPGKENGDYVLHFYSSKDLKKWDHVSDVLHERHNIEDVDIMAEDKAIICVYEKETVDKGRSAICLKKSEDKGRTWCEEKILLAADADQEPACFVKEDGGFCLYYSSDISSPGRSYMGAGAYRASFDRSFKRLGPGQIIPTGTKEGILLYDMAVIGGRRYFLYARNYLTDCDLVIEEEPGGSYEH
ncbi:MAG: hypothetical protein IK152_09350 [Lachnospiraceae bacterium]|nr:hypothetical protein [Lachnospiraceae bacterium]